MTRIRPLQRALSVVAWSAHAWLLLVPVTATAQSVRGVVTSAAGGPLQGALVALLDSAGAVIARDLTNANGEYNVAAPRAGRFRLRVARIGYRPETTTLLRLALGQSVVSDPIVFPGVPLSLDPITVRGRRSCDPRPEQQAVAHQLWDQARTALRVAELTVQRRPIEARVVVFQRRLDPGNGAVREEHSRSQRVSAVRPWASMPIDSLRENGYVVRTADGSAVYHAPGLDAIASDQFVADHCFRVEHALDSDSVAVLFEPTRERHRTPEIAGTAWLHRASAALRRIEFHYVNIPQEEQDGAGASLDFLQLPDGAWVISRWEIRMPVLRQEYIVASGRAAARVPRLVAQEVRAEGGELAVAAIAGDTVWTAPNLYLSGIVVDSESGRPIRGADVSIVGTAFHVSTDAGGRFRMAEVPLGDHTLRVSSESLTLVGESIETRITRTERGTGLTLRIPAARDVAAARCTRGEADAPAGVLAGRIRQAAGEISNGEVYVSWTSPDTSGEKGGRRTLRADRRGLFTACGLPLSDVTVEAASDSGVAGPVRVALSPTEPVLVLDLPIRQPANKGMLSGTIIGDVDGAPLNGVEIAIQALGLKTHSDADGRFHLTGIPSGEHTLDVRRIGYKEVSRQVAVAPGARLTQVFVLSRVTVLEAVDVEADALLPSFEEHRRVGLGTFLTRADIDKARGAPLSTLLREFPEVRVVGVRVASVASNRQTASISGIGFKCPETPEKYLGYVCACYSQVYLDGHLMYRGPEDPFFDINSIPPESVEAIEYYAGPAQTPARYSKLNSQCGVLVIHTRRYSPPKAPPD